MKKFCIIIVSIFWASLILAQERNWQTVGVFHQSMEVSVPKFSDGLVLVQDKHTQKWGYANRTGAVVIPFQFEEAQPFSEGLAAVKIKNESSSVFASDLWGYINQAGTMVVEPYYTSVEPFSEGLAAVSKSSLFWGYIDKKGKLVISMKFGSVAAFNEGLAAVRQNWKWGYLDRTGKVVISAQHSSAAKFSEGLAAVNHKGKFGYLDQTGRMIVLPQFEAAEPFSEGLALIQQNGKYGYIDKTGKVVIQPQYYYAQSFAEGLAAVQHQGKYAYIDKSGEVKIETDFDMIYSFSEGLAVVKKNNQYGYIDKMGQIITPIHFAKAEPFSEGLGLVYDFGYWTAIAYDKAAAAARSNEAKPIIQWDKPYEASSRTNHTTQELKVCVQSKQTIEEFAIYVNGVLQKHRGLGVEDDCRMHISGAVALEQGENIIQIRVANASGITQSERIVYYENGNAKKDKNASGHYHALLIGVNNYQDLSITNLSKPISDAQSVKTILTGQYTFEPDNVHLLANPTKEQIIDKITSLQSSLQEKDHLLIFYAGHGTEKNDMGYWLPSNAKPNSIYNWLSYDELIGYLKGIKAKHILVVADACYSGTMVLRDAAMQAKTCEVLDRTKSRRIITSGAKQAVPDESVFIKFFIQELKNNKYDCITSNQLFNQLTSPVIYNSPNGQLPQNGVIPNTGAEGGILSLKKDK